MSSPTVLNTNDNPIWLDTPNSTTLLTSDLFLFDVNASDVDKGDKLTYSIRSEPASSISIDQDSGMITWIPQAPDIYSINISLTDGTVILRHNYVVIVIQKNRIPQVTMITPTNLSVLEILNPELEWTVKDEDDDPVKVDLYLGKTLKDIQELNPNNRIAIGLESMNFIIPLSLERNSTYYWTVIPYDQDGAGVCISGIWSFKIHEDAEMNHAPYFFSEPELTANVGKEWKYEPSVLDIDEDNITIILDAGPDGTVFFLGVLSWTPAIDQIGENEFILIASDGEINVTQVFKVDVNGTIITNLKPIISTVTNKTIIAGDLFELQIVGTDPEGQDLTYNIITPPDGMAIGDNGLIFWQTDSSDPGTYYIICVVSDSEEQSSVSFSLVVEDVEDQDGSSEGFDASLIVIFSLIIIVLIIIIIFIIVFRKRQTPEEAEDDMDEIDEVEQSSNKIFIEKQMLDIQKENKKDRTKSKKMDSSNKDPESNIQTEEKHEDVELLPPAKIDLEDEDIIEEMPPSESDPYESEDPEFEDPEDVDDIVPEMEEARTTDEAMNAIGLLKELSELKEMGAITEEEYDKKKAGLLKKI